MATKGKVLCANEIANSGKTGLKHWGIFHEKSQDVSRNPGSFSIDWRGISISDKRCPKAAIRSL